MIRKADKWEYLIRMIREHDFRRGAEVGTGTGRTAMEVLKACSALHLIEVAWYPGPELIEGIAYCECQRARRTWQRHIEPYLHRVTIIELPSHEAVTKVKDESLDFVFIDADHAYEECLRDIQVWSPKVRLGGLICGDDYEHPWFPGVGEAVHTVFDANLVEHPASNVWSIWKT